MSDTGSEEGSTPTIEEFVKVAIEGRLLGVRVGMPAKVLSYDPIKQMCSVQPCLKKKYIADGSVVDLPPINNVPVGHLRAGKAIIHMPLESGNTVYLHFSDRSIDSWKTQGGIVDPADPRHHDLSDAVAYPGHYSFADKLTIPNPKMLTIMFDKAYIEVQPSGTFKFVGAQGIEMMDLLTRLIQAIITARTETLIGPQPLINEVPGEDFPTLYTLLSLLKGT